MRRIPPINGIIDFCFFPNIKNPNPTVPQKNAANKYDESILALCVSSIPVTGLNAGHFFQFTKECLFAISVDAPVYRRALVAVTVVAFSGIEEAPGGIFGYG